MSNDVRRMTLACTVWFIARGDRDVCLFTQNSFSLLFLKQQFTQLPLPLTLCYYSVLTNLFVFQYTSVQSLLPLSAGALLWLSLRINLIDPKKVEELSNIKYLLPVTGQTVNGERENHLQI